MALTQQQLDELKIAEARKNPTDIKNIEYAKAKFGYISSSQSYTQATGKSPFERITPEAFAQAIAPSVQAPPISTSAGTKKIFDEADARLKQYEMPTEEKSFDDLYTKEKERLESLYLQSKDEITRQGKKREEAATASGKAIVSESRTALASMGLISSEPDLAVSTGAIQYIADVKTQNAKQIDTIKQEEQNLLAAARDARDSKQYQAAQNLIKQADERRKERNSLTQQALADITTMRNLESQGKRDEIIALQEKRAGEKFDRDTAENALKYIDFNNFDQYTPAEVIKLEQGIGLPDGVLAKYASAAVRMKAMEGWESKITTNKMTGEITSSWVRISPELDPLTGKPKIETMSQSLGFMGERYADEAVIGMMKQYDDAGIIPQDTLAQAQAKLPNSRKYQKEVRIAPRGGKIITPPTEFEINAEKIEENLISSIGKDGFVSPDDYAMAKQDWIEAGGEPAKFDKEYAGRRDPNNPYYDLSVKTEEKEEETGMMTLEETTEETSKAIEELKGAGYSRSEAKKELYNVFGTDEKGKEITITKATKNMIEDLLVKIYGRTGWQKVIPGGR